MADSLSVTSASDDERDAQPNKRIKRILKRNEMRVYLRFRPLGPEQFRGPIGFNEEEKRLEGISSDEYLNSRVDDFRGLQFNRIFSETCSQDDFYAEVIAPILPDIFKERKSSVVFAYGVTNSGKTHSILGSSQSLQNGHHGDGILPRVLRFLVETKQAIISRLSEKIDFFHEENASSIERPAQLTNLSIDGIQLDLNTFSSHPSNSTLHLRDVKVLFENFEIYNEDIYDLQGDGVVNLDTSNFFEKKSASKKASASKTKLKLKEDLNKRVFIKDLVTNEVTDLDEASRLIKVAVENRRVRNNNLNAASSRSQCCFKIRIKLIYSHPFQAVEEEASLLILDLAGAERAKKTLNTGAKMAESCHINKTLLSLGNCIRALRNGDESIPYRDSKLTRVLREYFVDRNHVIMIVHLHPGLSYFDENINVLKYAAIGLEAKLKAAISLTDSKYQQNQQSFLLDSGSKKQDKSLLSCMSHGQMNLYGDFASLADQEHFFEEINPGEDHQHHDGGGVKGLKSQQYKDLENKSKEVDEKMRELEEKQHDLELKEIIMKQKLALEKFDMNFESMMQQEEAKLKMEREILMRFRMPDFECDFAQQHHGNVQQYGNEENMSQSKNKDLGNQQLSHKKQVISANQTNQLVQNSQAESIRRQESSQLSQEQVCLGEQKRIIQETNSNNKNKQLDPYCTQTPPRLSRRFDDEFEDQNINNIQQNSSQDNRLKSQKQLSQLHHETSNNATNNDGLKNQEERLIKRLLEVQLEETTNENRNSTNARFSAETFIENASHHKAQSQVEGAETHQDEGDVNISQSYSEGKHDDEEEGGNDSDNRNQDEGIISRRSSLRDSNDRVVGQINDINSNSRFQEIEVGNGEEMRSEIAKESKHEDSNMENLHHGVDQDSQVSNQIIKQSINDDACRTPADNEKTFIQQSTDKRQVFNSILRTSSELQIQENSNAKGSCRMEEEIVQKGENSIDNNSEIEDKCSQVIQTNEDIKGSQIDSQIDEQEDKLQDKMARLERQVQELYNELEMQHDQLIAREKQVAKQEEELSTLRAALAEKYTVQQEQIEKSMLNSEQLRNQLADQELKFTDETHKIMELQKNITAELQLLKEERVALQNKSEKLKSLQPTPAKVQQQSKQIPGIALGSDHHNHTHAHPNAHVNFDLGNNGEEKQRTPGRKHSDTIYPGHPIKTFSEKQIQTSAVRSVNSNKTISSQSSQPSQVDVGVYTFYTQSESDQGKQHVGQSSSGVNGSQIGSSANLTNSGLLGNKSKNNRGINISSVPSGNNKSSKNHASKAQQVQQSPVASSSVKKDLFQEQTKAGLGDIVERIEDENERMNEEKNDNSKDIVKKNDDKVNVESQVVSNDHGTMEIEKGEVAEIRNVEEDKTTIQIKVDADEENLKCHVEKSNAEGKDIECTSHEKASDDVESDVNQDQENKRQRGKKKVTKKQQQPTTLRRSSRNSTGSTSKNSEDDNTQTEDDDENETEEEKEEEEKHITVKGKTNKRNKKTTRSTSRDSNKSNKNKKINQKPKGSSNHSETEEDSSDPVKQKPTKVTNKKKNHRK